MLGVDCVEGHMGVIVTGVGEMDVGGIGREQRRRLKVRNMDVSVICIPFVVKQELLLMLFVHGRSNAGIIYHFLL